MKFRPAHPAGRCTLEGMRKVILAAVLALAAPAQAVTVEYATLSERPLTLDWQAPGKEASGAVMVDLVKSLGCTGEGLYSFLNCIGKQGWAFVTITTTMGAEDRTPVRTWVFTRTLP